MWISNNRRKFLLQYHLIFVCKYRKRLLIGKFSNDIKQWCYDISKTYQFQIKVMETDIDHIHFLIESIPNISITQIVRVLKQQSTLYAWNKYFKFLKKQYWNENTLWTDGYFVCSIGNANIENQG